MRIFAFTLLLLVSTPTFAGRVESAVIIDSNQFPTLVVADGDRRWRVRVVPRGVTRGEGVNKPGRPDWTGKQIKYRVLGKDVAGVYLVELAPPGSIERFYKGVVFLK
jgi:hypothetical protein